MATWPDLKGILAGLRWAVVGAVATRAYMPERSTRDLDILVAAEVAQEVRARLERAQFQRVQELAIGGATWRSPDPGLVRWIETSQERIRIVENFPSTLQKMFLTAC